MANRILEFFRVIFVSPEALAAAIVVALHYVSNISHSVGVALDRIRDPRAVLPVVVAVIAAAFFLGMKVLYPKADNRVLVEWSAFGRLRLRVSVALVLSFFGVIFAAIVLLFDVGSTELEGLVVMLCLTIAIVSLATLAFAAIAVREHVEKLR